MRASSSLPSEGIAVAQQIVLGYFGECNADNAQLQFCGCEDSLFAEDAVTVWNGREYRGDGFIECLKNCRFKINSYEVQPVTGHNPTCYHVVVTGILIRPITNARTFFHSTFHVITSGGRGLIRYHTFQEL